MAIDPLKEKLMPVPQACRVVLPDPPSPATTWRWATGPAPRLEVIKIKGRVYTSVEALLRFIAARQVEQPPQSTQAERDAATTRRLQQKGLL